MVTGRTDIHRPFSTLAHQTCFETVVKVLQDSGLREIPAEIEPGLNCSKVDSPLGKVGSSDHAQLITTA